MFEGLDDHVVPVPTKDFNPAVDIVEAESAIGGKRECLVEVLLKRIGGRQGAKDFCPLHLGFTQCSGSDRLRGHGRAGGAGGTGGTGGVGGVDGATT